MPEQPSLAGSLARIDRADELIAQLDAALKAFLLAQPYTVEERPDDNPAARTFVVTAVREVPARPRIMAGEAAHHLRAALDLLAYQLLLQAGVDDEKRLRACAFPIVVKCDLSDPKSRKKHDDAIRSKIGGVSRKAYDRIIALQPCVRNGEWSHLAQIQALDNTDKHRLLLAATSSTRIGGWNFRDEHGNVTTMPHHSFLPLQVDAMLRFVPPCPDFPVPNLANAVAFMEPGLLFGQPVEHILQNLLTMTRKTVESFADCF
jgi:hypothetical protein